MSKAAQFKTRNDVLIHFALEQKAQRGISEQKFTDRLVEEYCRRVPDGYRKAPLLAVPVDGAVDEFFAAQKSNLKAVQRYLRKEVRIPLEVEEAWAASLDEPFRSQCVFDLCARHNVLPVLLHGETDIQRLSELMHEEAEAIQAMAPIMADGKISQSDAEYAPEAIRRLQHLMSSCAGLIRKLEDECHLRADTLETVSGVR